MTWLILIELCISIAGAVYVGDNKIAHYNKVGKVGEIVCEDIDSYISDCFVLFRRAKKGKMGIINRTHGHSKRSGWSGFGRTSFTVIFGTAHAQIMHRECSYHAVSPISRHKMVSQKSHIIQRTISFPSAHSGKREQCLMPSNLLGLASGSGNDFTSWLSARKRGTKGVTSLINHTHGRTSSQVLATSLSTIHESPHFSGKQVAERALSKVGMKGYKLLFKNCEHFAKWCKYNVEMKWKLVLLASELELEVGLEA